MKALLSLLIIQFQVGLPLEKFFKDAFVWRLFGQTIFFFLQLLHVLLLFSLYECSSSSIRSGYILRLSN